MNNYDRIQDEQGWNDATMLMLTLDFIREMEQVPEFEDYLTKIVRRENTSELQ